MDVISTKRTAHGTVVGAPHSSWFTKVRETSEEQAEWNAAGDIIVDAQPRQLLLACEIDDPERGPDHPAVERHAAIPQLQNFDRVPEILAEIVEEHVADAARRK